MAPQRNIDGQPYYHRVEWWKDEFGQWFKRNHYVGLWQARAWKTVHCMVLVLGPTLAIIPPFLILPGVVVESEALHCSECAVEDESHQAKVGCMEGCQVQCDSQALCPEAARALQQVQSRFSQELQIIKS